MVIFELIFILIMAKLKGYGITFIILGGGAFILPFFGVQFRLISIFGEYQLFAAFAAIILGIIMLVYGYKKNL